MRQSHAAGDKLFVDYAGDGVPVVIDRLTGERRAARIFIGASGFTYAQATWTQGLVDWIGGQYRSTRTVAVLASLCAISPGRSLCRQNMPRRSASALLQRTQMALKPASIGLLGVFMRSQDFNSMIADGAFKRVQIDAADGRDTGESH